ncbi:MULTISPECIES: DUF6268 family outer membrane beta-barrel protein [Altibacter]|uniref:DUF6268 family outer membrane beta-barrel protein n=1 Tax=Altibacter TaxID=1535231 RepID=UPI0005503C45|nr:MULTISPECIES: DUF6268 family outer membrane beta-barrel protein [Altibacter]MCW8982400.1 DUF6268 family outer membrane beta-barrel protein [Altibacter sp.]MCW9038762.1 DUF6268 family outer membrane beta-barrel protein [Altibacter sp.]
MKKLLVVCAFFFTFTSLVFSQTTDLARIEYLYIPFGNSNNSISRYRALVQAPIPLQVGSGKFLVIGLEYRYVDISIEEPVPFDPSMVSSVQQMDGYIGYTYKLKNDWRLGFKAGVQIQSNLEGDLVSDDFIYHGAVYAIKDMKKDSIEKPYRWILGLTYSTTPGRNFPLPLINYYKEFHPNWTYTLGVPKTNVRHYLNTTHKDALQAFVTLDNFFGNVQNNITIPGNPVVGENISMTNVIAGLGYEHFFTEHLLFYAYGAHSVYNEFRLRDNNRETAYIINDENTFYVRGGIKFKY